MAPATSTTDGTEIKRLITLADERGFFREIVRETDLFFLSGSASGASR